jgi:hypothetical protein
MIRCPALADELPALPSQSASGSTKLTRPDLRDRVCRLPACVRGSKQRLRSMLLCAVGATLMTSVAMAGCTWYVSPLGGYRGRGPQYPTTLQRVILKTQPGDVVCLEAGTYSVDTPFGLYHSGTPTHWITYTTFRKAAAVLIPNSGNGPLLLVGATTQYLEINGLEFDGQNTADTAISCSGCDHLRVIGNKIRNTGSSGIITYKDRNSGKTPDYITIDHNQVYHGGYNQGFGSGISLSRHAWSDRYPGFHSFVTNNIISGMYDNSVHQSEGNGIVMDDQAGDDTPPVLIANNVIYQNGRRCMISRYASRIWMVNNTCYKNNLARQAGEFQFYLTTENYAVNNLSFGWSDSNPYLDAKPLVDNHYHYNQWTSSGTGQPQVVPPGLVNDPTAFKHVRPLFNNPPYVSDTGQGQYNNAVPTDQIKNQFYLRTGSPAILGGIDPTTIPGISPEIIGGLSANVFRDIDGKPRYQGSRFDLGAYAYRGK